MPRKYTEFVSYEYTMKKISSPTSTKTEKIINKYDDDGNVDVLNENKTLNNDLNNNSIDDNVVVVDEIDDDSFISDNKHSKQTTTNRLNDDDDDEYNPYSYGFRPLSEKNIYRSFEIIRQPTTTTTSTSTTDEKKSTKIKHQKSTKTTTNMNNDSFDEIDNQKFGHTKVIFSEENLSPSPTSAIKNRQGLTTTTKTTIPTIMVNERPVDVPGYYPSSKHQSKITTKIKNQESDSRKKSTTPRIIEIKLQKSSESSDEIDHDSKQIEQNDVAAAISTAANNDSNSKKPPLPPNHHHRYQQRRRISMPATTGHRKYHQEQREHEQQQQPRPSSSSAIHNDYRYHHHDQPISEKFWPDFHYPLDSRWPFYWPSSSDFFKDHHNYHHRDSIISNSNCPFSSPILVDKLIHTEPKPSKFHSYKCTRYELSKEKLSSNDDHDENPTTKN
ncbi:uncharacterized protein LOC113794652 [Dermatophagoides pteronyssinus]|uniref:uncharacterized protein LOC113794652 n=1 Tax=Dermatophagoides pteronyssinus TaxID=6956 RepID=UPI003F67CBE6